MKLFNSYYFIYKFSLWGVILYCLFFLVLGIIGNGPKYIPVSPPYDESFSYTLASFPDATVFAMGKLEILKPTLFQKIILTDIDSYTDVINNLFWLVFSVNLLLLVNSIETNAGFKGEIPKFIRIAGLALIIYSFIDFFRNAYVANEVLKLTENKYHYGSMLQSPNHLELWLGILLLWFARSYKKAMQLQSEQDLTI